MRIRPRVPVLVLAFLVAALAVRPAWGQPAGLGTVAGRATGDDDGAPVAFALVRLLPEGAGAPKRTVLTDGRGAFRFEGVAPGAYRLQLERIGYTDETTEVFAVAAGETVERGFRSAPRAVTIEAITTTAGACYTAAELERDPELAALWREAVKGMETRAAFDARYRYTFDLRQTAVMEPTRRHRRAVHDTLTRTFVNDPLAAPVDRGRRGFGTIDRREVTLDIPDGKELLTPGFLTQHCLETASGEVEGAWELRFRPVRPRGGRVNLRGAVLVDAESFQLRALRLEYLSGRRRFMEATVHYQEARVSGGTVRLPAVALFSGRPPYPLSRTLRSVTGEALYTNYGNVERVDAP
ncbi:MAG TPA: carboxypeptidase-like regulatory domain-containing protein [Longimicrobium sp.]|nr:carboxypeptidase-like regulatory domain-containing protein [Longimicrobium sp.]